VGLVDAIGMNQKKRGKNRVRLVNYRGIGVGKKLPFNAAFGAPVVPAVLNPGPGFIVNIDKILIVEVNLGEIVLYHPCSFEYIRKCLFMVWQSFLIVYRLYYTVKTPNFPCFFSNFCEFIQT
jgi:hypothetical protein